MLFSFHKWVSSIAYYGLNRLDLHSIIRFRQAIFADILCCQSDLCSRDSLVKYDYLQDFLDTINGTFMLELLCMR